MPRDRFHTRNRARIGEILREAFDAESVDYELRLSESVLVRIHFIVRTGRGELPDYDVEQIERRIVQATREWTDELHDALIEDCSAAIACSAATGTRSRPATTPTGSRAAPSPTSGASRRSRPATASG